MLLGLYISVSSFHGARQLLLVLIAFVRTDATRAIDLQRVGKLIMVLLLLVVVVHGSRGAALVRRYRHHVLDGAVGFLRIENIRVVSFNRIWLLVLLLVYHHLLIGCTFSYGINQALILLHNHDEAILRFWLDFTCRAHDLVELRYIFWIAFTGYLRGNLLLATHLCVATKLSAFLEATRFGIDDHLLWILTLLLRLG